MWQSLLGSTASMVSLALAWTSRVLFRYLTRWTLSHCSLFARTWHVFAPNCCCCYKPPSVAGFSTMNTASSCVNPIMLYQVGLKGHVGPWTVTPSVYSMVLLNVASTVKQGALYPAKPYHEDVDFAHLCEERKLVVVKCNWLYYHKVPCLTVSEA